MTSNDDDLKAKAKNSALASLAMREHSVLELEQKLLRKDMPEAIVADLLRELQEQNLLSDERFAEVYWRQRASKGFGPVKIRYELQQRGVDDSLIESAKNESDVDFNQVIIHVYRKKYQSIPYQNLNEKSKRQRFLYRRGFPAELIKRVMN